MQSPDSYSSPSPSPGAPALPIGHPLAFCRTYLGDPDVSKAVSTYEQVRRQKISALADGRFDEAWELLLLLKEIEQDLEARCQGH